MKALSLSIGLCLALPALALAQLSTNQMTALPPAQADQIVRKDLLSVLEPKKEIGSGGSIEVPYVLLNTHPYGTFYPGLCQRDTLLLRYARTDSTSKPREGPLQPYGLETGHGFYAVRVPTPEDDKAHLTVWNDDCRDVDQKPDTFWFGAPSEYDAARAVNLLSAALDQIRAGALKIKSCDTFSKQGSCEERILAAGGISKIENVDTCPVARGTQECFVIAVDNNISLTIQAEITAPDFLVPTKITSIEAAAYLDMYHGP